MFGWKHFRVLKNSNFSGSPLLTRLAAVARKFEMPFHYRGLPFVAHEKVLHQTVLQHTYMAHAVVFAVIRMTKTREHFAESSYTTQLQVQTM